MKLLVIEDDAAIRRILAKYGAKAGEILGVDLGAVEGDFVAREAAAGLGRLENAHRLVGVVGGGFLTMGTHGADQLMVQRYLSARNQRDVRTGAADIDRDDVLRARGLPRLASTDDTGRRPGEKQAHRARAGD